MTTDNDDDYDDDDHDTDDATTTMTSITMTTATMTTTVVTIITTSMATTANDRDYNNDDNADTRDDADSDSHKQISGNHERHRSRSHKKKTRLGVQNPSLEFIKEPLDEDREVQNEFLKEQFALSRGSIRNS